MARAFSGDELKRLRKAKGWTAFKLGSEAGVQPPQIYRYELGKDVPQPANLVALADALGVAVDELFVDTPDPVEAAK